MSALPIIIALNDKKTQEKTNKLIKLAENLICRAKGSCAPKLQAAVRQVGTAGYRRGTPDKWNYYHLSGIYLSWDLTKPYNAQNWYFGSGYFEKLQNTGLDNCCLKAKWPPAEAFPLTGGAVTHRKISLPNGWEVEVDAANFDLNTFQTELDTFFGKKENEKPIPENVTSITPPIAGNALLPLLALIAFNK